MKFINTLLLLLIFTFLGCSDNPSDKLLENNDNTEIYGGTVRQDELPTDNNSYNNEEKHVISSNDNLDDKIIKKAILKYPVEDIEKTYDLLFENIKKNGGFIQSDDSGINYNSFYRNITIRVPNKNFNSLLNSLSKDVAYFDTKTITALNVTQEFIDVEARLKTKKALEDRYLALLSKASKISEILEIEKSISLIREDIESVQGRLNYLKEQVSYSTISIEMYHIKATGKEVSISYLTKLWNAFAGGFYSISGFFLNLVSIWPYLILIIAIVFFTRKTIFKKGKQNNTSE